MLGDRSSYLNDGRFLKRICAYHSARDLACYGDYWNAIEKRVSEAADEVGGAGTGSGDAYAGAAGGASVALGCENTALFVPREYVTDDGGASESLMNFHGCSSRVSEHMGNALAFERFNEDIAAFPGFIGGKSRNECLRSGGQYVGGGG